jgi:hypothetical protein
MTATALALSQAAVRVVRTKRSANRGDFYKVIAHCSKILSYANNRRLDVLLLQTDHLSLLNTEEFRRKTVSRRSVRFLPRCATMRDNW